MTPILDDETQALTHLAEGRLGADARRDLVRRTLRDPQLAAHMKLALRLADGSAEITRDWIRSAAPTVAPAYSWWRPLAGVAASLAVVAMVLSVPRMSQVQPAADVVAVQAPSALPDQIGSASFEAPELFGGSFEGQRSHD